MSLLMRINWIRAAWILAPIAGVIYGVWWWPETEAGQEQRKRSEQVENAEIACERLKLAADSGAERIVAHDMCEAMKKRAWDEYRR